METDPYTLRRPIPFGSIQDVRAWRNRGGRDHAYGGPRPPRARTRRAYHSAPCGAALEELAVRYDHSQNPPIVRSRAFDPWAERACPKCASWFIARLAGAPIVVAGTKYRIRGVEGRAGRGALLVALAPKRLATHRLAVRELTYDAIAGVWRAGDRSSLEEIR